jgi:polyisoprenoid-binding protein YceI
MTSSNIHVTESNLRTRLSDGSFTGVWKLDPERSTVELESRILWGLVRVKGRFKQLSGDGVVTPDGDVSGSVLVEAASIDTKSKKRDQHLRSHDFFNTNVFPCFVFKVERLNWSKDRPELVGTLRVRDSARSLQAPISVSLLADNFVQLDAEFAVERTEFGLDWNRMGLVSTKTVITTKAVFTRGEHSSSRTTTGI